MKFRHVILLMVLIALSLGSVSAGDNVTYFNNTTNITFEDVDFTIPAGFSYDNLPEDYDELGSHGKTAVFNCSDGDTLIVTVIYDWMGMSLDELYVDGADKAVINGHEGWNYTQNNLTCFAYIDGDHGIIISSNNQSRISEVII